MTNALLGSRPYGAEATDTSAEPEIAGSRSSPWWRGDLLCWLDLTGDGRGTIRRHPGAVETGLCLRVIGVDLGEVIKQVRFGVELRGIPSAHRTGHSHQRTTMALIVLLPLRRSAATR